MCSSPATVMSDFLVGATVLVLLAVGFGLAIILRRPELVDRMMAVQLLGTGGIGCVLLLGAATDVTAVLDVALILAVLAAFTALAFVKAGNTVQAARQARAARERETGAQP